MSFVGILTRWVMVLILAMGGAHSSQAQASVSKWNAHLDFYFDSTSTANNTPAWAGAKSPSATGSAWGYYAANANGNGFPSQIGSYFGTPSLYPLANHNPAGGGAPAGTEVDAFDFADGANFARYARQFEGKTFSVGSFERPWFEAAPGFPAGGGAVWLQAAWLDNPAAEGLATVLTWTAPSAGTFRFAGSFQIGNNGENSGASTAIVASTDEVLLARSTPAMGSNQAFKFEKTFKKGDTVQFQVGTDCKIGAAVGLNVEVTSAVKGNDTQKKEPKS
jgi:hypothetical protein